ncbi:uncharacterized protein At1g65710-like isoform X2 [Impatiens glandulifera]|uniref:uncharacterized protein At1g65710-like isoform X2 n=1 Tax=Impatiens glandulifera TaxID=253017 RepID=UPI001FB07D02|nr:uncharacterized protein At1g65710-like isoform X2 [Impatiens glandulifera]
MGSCLSKKTTSPTKQLPAAAAQTELKPQIPEESKKLEDQETVKKEIFVIRHRRSHDLDRFSEDDNKHISLQTDNNSIKSDSTGNISAVSGSAVVRTSSCTKEEVDAILIQCGRLSRSSFNGKSSVISGSSENQTSGGGGGGHRRKYSGSKRSYDFDQEGSNNENRDDDVADGDDDETAAERIHRYRQRQRQSRPSSSSGSRRRTPSRERDQLQQQRSGSRERNTTSSGTARRVSRSPNRRSESPITGNIIINNVVNKPGKMVSVPATISSLVMDKSNNLAAPGTEPPSSAGGVKRIQVKRNVSVNVTGSEPISRTAASPRSRSPARTNSKAAAETLNAIANANVNATQPLTLSRSNSRKAEQSPYRRNPLGEIDQNITTINQKSAKDVEQEKSMITNVSVTIVPPNSAVGRTRSSRLSRDFDINPETLTNNNNNNNQSPNPTSYTALLLEDIQNFHQKNSITTPTTANSLPCLAKACSILEAVADLNSSTGSSNLSLKKRTFVSKEPPFVESKIVGNDDIMEPSIHKYVTVRRGGAGGDIEDVESSGSNNVVGGQQQQWVSPSSWEPNSADSTDHWTSSYCSSRYTERDEDPIDIRRRTSERKSGGGVGKNRVGSGRSLYSSPAMAAATT